MAAGPCSIKIAVTASRASLCFLVGHRRFLLNGVKYFQEKLDDSPVQPGNWCSTRLRKQKLTMTEKAVGPEFDSLERQFGIPPEKYCGLTPEDMSRAIVAYHSGPRRSGQPVGYCPVGSLETRLSWLRGEFGPEADVERIRLQEQFFSSRVSRSLKVDWMLPNQEFDRAVGEGLEEHFPELTEEARQVIAGNYSYSHAK
jgi:hypothetical protein